MSRLREWWDTPWIMVVAFGVFAFLPRWTLPPLVGIFWLIAGVAFIRMLVIAPHRGGELPWIRPVLGVLIGGACFYQAWHGF
ncbi:MAG TPA: hypothetical protein VEI97_10300 [bacterium]|nr:hypothetical protein [bacterium]